MDPKQYIIEQRKKGVSDDKILAELKNRGLINQSVSQPQSQPSGGFLRGVANFAGGALDSTLGRKSALGFGTEVGKVFMLDTTNKNIRAAEETSAGNASLAQSADTLIAQAQKETDPVRKTKLLSLANSLIRTASDQRATAQGMLSEAQKAVPQTNKIASTALNTAATAVGFGRPVPASTAGRIAEGAAMGATMTAADNLDKNQNILQGVGTGALIGGALPAVGWIASKSFKSLASTLSGVPKPLLEKAYQEPEIVGKAVSQYVKDPDSELKLLNAAQSAFIKVKNARGAAYSEGLKAIEQSGKKVDIPKQVVFSKLSSTLKELGVEVGSLKDGKISFSNSVLSGSDEKTVREMIGVINKWTDVSPTGLNRLAIKLGNYRNKTANDAFNIIPPRLKESLREALGEQIPEIGILNAEYGASSKFLEALTSEFGNAIKGNGSRTLLLNRLTQLYSKDNPLRQQLIAELGEKGGQDLMNQIVGATLSKWMPIGNMRRILEGLTGVAAGAVGIATGASGVVPAVAAGVSASPRIAGQAARFMGKLKPITQRAQRAAATIIPQLRQ